MNPSLTLLAMLAGLLPLSVYANGDKTPKSGAEVYEHYCAACHDTGQLGAPKLGDRKAWRPLIAEGQRMLERTSIRGIRKMPPKGGHPHLSDLEVKRAVAYMANAAGGRFKTYE